MSKASGDGKRPALGASVLPAPGAWRVQVGLQLGEFENPVTTIPLTVG